MKKKMLKLLIGSLCLSALIGILIILLGKFGTIETRVLATTLLVFGYSIPGLCSSTIYEKKEYHYFSIIGMVLAFITCLYLICIVWNIIKFNLLDYFQWNLIFTLNILCWSSGHLSLIFLINNKNSIVSTFKNLTVILSILIDIMILLPIWSEFDPPDFYYRLLWVIGILITLGTLVTPILNKIYKSQESSNNLNNENVEILDSKQTKKDVINKNNKIIILTLLVIAICAIPICYFSIQKNTNKKAKIEKLNLKEVLDEPPSYEYYDISNYYFMYDNKVYYYKEELNSNHPDKFYSMNLDGSNNKLIAESEMLRYAEFYFVYDDEAYYYTRYGSENKKINLKTGKITSLKNSDYYIPQSFKDGIVSSFKDSAVYEDSYSIFKKIDLRKNKKIFEIKTNSRMSEKTYGFDYNGSIYYLDNSHSKPPTIYRNNDILYEFTTHNKDDFEEFSFIAFNNNYLYFKLNNHIYKLNLTTKVIDKEINYNLGDIHRMSSGNNIDNYYYISNKIYSLNFENDTFELILKDVENEPTEVYNINNKLIFTENTDNLKYRNVPDDNLGSVILYDLENKIIINQYNGIRKVSFDKNYMYLVVNGDKDYYIDKISLVD